MCNSNAYIRLKLYAYKYIKNSTVLVKWNLHTNLKYLVYTVKNLVSINIHLVSNDKNLVGKKLWCLLENLVSTNKSSKQIMESSKQIIKTLYEIKTN